jgi:hypothetical protein
LLAKLLDGAFRFTSSKMLFFMVFALQKGAAGKQTKEDLSFEEACNVGKPFREREVHVAIDWLHLPLLDVSGLPAKSMEGAPLSVVTGLPRASMNIEGFLC